MGLEHLFEREDAWGALEAALGQAAAGQGQLVSVAGEAGIGKTSLVLRFLDAKRGAARCYVGGCEHLSTPEPLGPLHDIARESQGRFRLSGESQLATFDGLLRLLKGGRGPGLLLLEDIHWADNATLDCLRFLTRRLRDAPVLAIVTLRNDEAESRVRLTSLWDDLPRDLRQSIVLRPLSRESVDAIAAKVAGAPRDVYTATGGNPFLVTEYLAAGGSGTPATVRDATLVRTAGLSRIARRVLDCAAIFPRRVDARRLRTISGDDDDLGLAECLRSSMLRNVGDALSFRHELARSAIEESLTPLTRRELHGAALYLLKSERGASAAEKAHHAERAGAVDDFVAFSIEAARAAADVGAHLESVAHFTQAIRGARAQKDGLRVEWLEELAASAELCGAIDIARVSIDEAIALRRAAGNLLSLGNALRLAARISWVHGEVDLADAQSMEALASLQDFADTWQYAHALSGQSQLDMLADRLDGAIKHGEAAMAIAAKEGLWGIYLHAATNVGTAQCGIDAQAGLSILDHAIAQAKRVGEPDFQPRLYSNKAFTMVRDRKYEDVFATIAAGLAVAEARDNSIAIYMRGSRALALIDLGKVSEALAEMEAIVAQPHPRGTVMFTVQTALSRARVRLGLPEGGVIEEMRAQPAVRRDLMRMVPVAVCDAEAVWLGEERPGTRERLRAAFDRAASRRWAYAELALWLSILGEKVALDDARRQQLPPAHRAHIEGSWGEAAESWRALGCPYEQAIALSNGDEEAKRGALAIFESLGARPAARNLRRAMIASGIRSISIGPRAARRKHAAGLTRRQQQVLELIATGLTNLEIAERLGLALRTAENHVAAVLALLQAPNRGHAAQIARERGLLNTAGSRGESE